jgi:hypothetical protein
MKQKGKGTCSSFTAPPRRRRIIATLHTVDSAYIERYGSLPHVDGDPAKENVEVDLFDLLADTLVWLNWQRCRLFGGPKKPLPTRPQGLFQKLDSSTGYAQIFSFVAINAVNFALDRGLDTLEGLGLPPERRPERDDPADRYMFWRRLPRYREFIIRLSGA